MLTPLKPTVLFLEDDADSRDLVRFTLEQAGMNVISVETVAEAWKMADQQIIDLFLLDGLIPNGDSLELCRDLRNFAPTKPIVFYSGLAYKADIERGLAAGATAYLVKPFFGDLAEEILYYVHGGKTRKLSEPLFVDKQYAMEMFDGGSESERNENAQIAEFPGAFDRNGNIKQFGTEHPERLPRRRSFRNVRSTGGII